MNNAEEIKNKYRAMLTDMASNAAAIDCSFEFEIGSLLCFHGGAVYNGYSTNYSNHNYVTGKYMVAAESIGQFVFDEPAPAIDKFLEILGFGFLKDHSLGVNDDS